ncbi:MAG TPA: zinc-ribbon domain containing protein [Chloroflexota bacterium]|nr:zinc-ribbon domain containing protein [Chloroflexota bacterium]
MPDQELVCRDCGTTFVFSADEQRFFAERGFENAPSRCPECRQARRAGGPQGHGGRGPRSDRVMTDVTCSSCGKETQVPFVPTAGRPVYCSDCYSSQRPQSGGGRRY